MESSYKKKEESKKEQSILSNNRVCASSTPIYVLHGVKPCLHSFTVPMRCAVSDRNFITYLTKLEQSDR